MYSTLKQSARIAGASLLITSLHAQSQEVTYQLDEFTISAGPIPRLIEEFSTPFTVLDSKALQQQNARSLGELLDGEPGVTASSFGAGASRPIIRGFDGPRIQILDSGLKTIDVSATSPDHAVSTEPLLVERVEVLRGPATLLYGSSAIGGVVNVIGREIPRAPVTTLNTLEGSVESRFDTASDGWTTLGYGTFGGENWALTVTGLDRSGNDYTIPGEAEIHDEDEEEHDEEESHSSELENSFLESDAFSIGGSWFFGTGNYIGAAYSQYNSLYGVPGHAHEEEEGHDDEEEEEESVSIDLKRKRFDTEFVILEPTDWIAATRIRFGYTDYNHIEQEGSETGTVFKNEGWELRGELSHQPWWILSEGVIGLQVNESDFSAIGEEAFTPPATTENQAVFISETIDTSLLQFGFGGRIENQKIAPDNASGSDYSDTSLSFAVNAIWQFTDTQSLSLSLQRSERHPTSSELYADGAHLATSQFERGDSDLGIETAYGIDFGYRLYTDTWEAQLSLFYMHFEDYIFANETGAEVDELPLFQYEAVDADFWGFEFELNHKTYESANTELTLRLTSDYVQAVNEQTDDDLPRIPPLRIGAGAQLTHYNWDAGILLRRSFEQDKVAINETTTEGYTELELNVARSFELSNGHSFTIFAIANNLLDEEIRQHTSFLKDVAPLPGKSLTIGARFEF